MFWLAVFILQSHFDQLIYVYYVYNNMYIITVGKDTVYINGS